MSSWWLVQSPYWDVVMPVTDDGRGPSERTCDLALVQADTAREAKWTAYRLWEKHGGEWPRAREDWHPLHGVKAQRWESIGSNSDPTPSEQELKAWEPFVAHRGGDG